MADDPSSRPRPGQGNRSGNSGRRRSRGGGGSGGGGGGGRSGGGGGRSGGRSGNRPNAQRRPQGQRPAPTPEPAPVRTVASTSTVEVVDDNAATVAANRRRARLIVSTPGAVVAVVVIAVVVAAGVPLAAPAGLVLGALVSLAFARNAVGVVLRGLGAAAVDEEDAPSAFNQIDGLCASMGLAPPDVYMVDDPHPDAMAVGRSDKEAVLVLTSALVHDMGPVELEGVLAHELTHVKRNDVAPTTVAAALALLLPFMPDPGARVHRWAGRGREFQADAEAVRVTRYPPGLRQALAHMDESKTSRLPGRRAGQVTRWLWTSALPVSGQPIDLTGEMDAPVVRMTALDEW